MNPDTDLKPRLTFELRYTIKNKDGTVYHEGIHRYETEVERSLGIQNLEIYVGLTSRLLSYELTKITFHENQTSS